jgi:hypothetical protein
LYGYNGDKRDDPDLVAAVETLGKRLWYRNLAIVDVPDDVIGT